MRFLRFLLVQLLALVLAAMMFVIMVVISVFACGEDLTGEKQVDCNGGAAVVQTTWLLLALAVALGPVTAGAVRYWQHSRR